MKKEDQEIVNRYIYQVLKRIPKDQKEDIQLELQELIDDMTEETGSVQAALTKLGDPAILSKKYREDSGCLIGPEYYDTYLWFLKIILLCSIIPIFIVTIIDGFRTTSFDQVSVSMIVDLCISIFAETFSNILASLLGTFGGVTLIFAIMEHQKVKIDLKKNGSEDKKPWSVEDLTPLPDKKAIIERKDSIVNIIFITIFCVLLIFVPHFFSVVLKIGEETIRIPIFNLQNWKFILPLFIGSLVLSLIDDIVRLVMGVYCKAVMISKLITGTLQIVLAFIILKILPFWNSELPLFAEKFPKDAKEIVMIWNSHNLSNAFLFFIVIITLLEMTFTTVKSIKYGHKTLCN